MKQAVKKSLRAVGTFSREHQGNPVVRAVCLACGKISQGYRNVIFDPEINGENRVLREMATWTDIETVFDVGANTGEWAAYVSGLYPTAQIHCFEPLSSNFQQLTRGLAQNPAISLNNFGLSSQAGEAEMRYSSKEQTTATFADVVAASGQGTYFDRIETCVIKTPDDYLTENDIDKISFLKIDVEGLDYDVLKAFPLDKMTVPIIQFEFVILGTLNRYLLRDFFEFLEPLGYDIYKILPRILEKMVYEQLLERVPDGNYLAIHRSVQNRPQ